MGRFIKLVVIGSSGVGKTSIRAQYISGRFATGYRATIGTDFITKTVPHHSDPTQEPVTLQIWDTAGQERFSSLSTAFFRGADAVILVFDVNKPETLIGLRRWWDEFRDRVPIADGDEAKYCVVVVGNKCDLFPSSRRASKETAGPTAATTFLKNLIPVPEDLVEHNESTPSIQEAPVGGGVDLSSEPPSPITTAPPASSLSASRPPILPTIYSNSSISALNSSEQNKSPSGSQSTPRLSQLNFNRQSRFSTSGTMTSTRTSMSIYHTPSSSLFESPLHDQVRSDSPVDEEEHQESPTSGSLPIQSTSHPLQSSRQRLDDPFDLEFDFATAKSTPVHSPSPSPHGSRRRPNPKARPRLPSTSSESSIITVKPDQRNLPSRALFPDLVITDDAASDTADSSSTRSQEPADHTTPGFHPVDPLTPSASPPSPPKLTASLLASLSQNPTTPSSSLKESNLEVGPKLFFTSAKTGGVAPSSSSKAASIDGVQITPVAEIFEYVAKRVVERWEWEEKMMEFAEHDDNNGDGLSVRLGTNSGGSGIVRLGERFKDWVGGSRRSCCA
ncbi:hypothetical protein FRC03_002310 [Tulasnella sp. 419]|nr:hypothetical protein FRC03_002310 [Tulasnella sp. 419]